METERLQASGLDAPEMIVRTCRRSTEVAMRHLVHMVLDDAWSSQLAAQRMLELVGGDLRILQRARARLLHASLERTTPITERALATLDLALHPVASPLHAVASR